MNSKCSRNDRDRCACLAAADVHEAGADRLAVWYGVAWRVLVCVCLCGVVVTRGGCGVVLRVVNRIRYGTTRFWRCFWCGGVWRVGLGWRTESTVFRVPTRIEEG